MCALLCYMHPFSSTLLDWYEKHGRVLPWRETADPYRIWISEIILQQTRVVQGYDYFLRFVERFPTVRDLAGAASDEVMRLWEGLGYYSRARNLHVAAKQIVERGGFPTDYEGVRALKGVGDYTAAAICSFAFGLPTAVVDGNVYRVLSRYFGISLPIDTVMGKKHFVALASELLVPDRAADYNQAIMDFGALQCVPRAPKCHICPLVDTCAARVSGQVECLPVKSKKVTVTERFFTYIILVDTSGGEEALWIRRRSAGDIWQGLYEPLLLETPAPLSEEEVMQHEAVTPLLNGRSTWRLIAKNKIHQLTHRRLHADAYLLRGEIPCIPNFVRVVRSDCSAYAFPKLVNILFENAFGNI